MNVIMLQGQDRIMTIPCRCGKQYTACFDFSASLPGTVAARATHVNPAPVKSAFSQPGARPGTTGGSSGNEHNDDLPEIEAEPVADASPPRSSSPALATPGSSELCVPVFQVDDAGKATVICPTCGFSSTMQVPFVLAPKQIVNIECRCRTCFRCRFEFPALLDPSRRQPGEIFPLRPGELAGLETKLFHANDEGKATILCPRSGYSKQLDARADKRLAHPMGFLCPCGEIIRFRIEFRKSYRKRVNLSGEYTNLRRRKKGWMYIKDISFGGVGFMAQIDPDEQKDHGISPQDLLELSFWLDDRLGTEILRRVVVRFVRDNCIGTQFSERRAHDKELGFYLMA